MAVSYKKRKEERIKLARKEEADESKIFQLPYIDGGNSGKSHLRQVILYLYSLYKNGEISKNGFEVLVEHACMVFVKTEAEKRLSAYLERKLLDLLNRLSSEDAVLKLIGLSERDV